MLRALLKTFCVVCIVIGVSMGIWCGIGVLNFLDISKTVSHATAIHAGLLFLFRAGTCAGLITLGYQLQKVNPEWNRSVTPWYKQKQTVDLSSAPFYKAVGRE